ncbi:hypothetical protein A3K80_08020 [Candidatus Bathyarchaeota archaeon RBG_13_38_9]|nr:MAG: hypothetical protein A3K80_08020 [Candidatus Bathyarchaeota archaeon RBG_13_38_9]
MIRRFIVRVGSQDSNDQNSTVAHTHQKNNDNNQSKIAGSKPQTGMYANPGDFKIFEKGEEQAVKDINEMNVEIDCVDDLIVDPKVINEKEDLKNHYQILAEIAKRPDKMNDKLWKAKHVSRVINDLGPEEGNKWLIDNFHLSPQDIQQLQNYENHV